jgi:hypothetical protein
MILAMHVAMNLLLSVMVIFLYLQIEPAAAKLHGSVYLWCTGYGSSSLAVEFWYLSANLTLLG